MSQSLQPAYMVEWRGRSHPTYDVKMKDFWPRKLMGVQRGVYALNKGNQMEFGRSRMLPKRVAQRKSSSPWARRALVFDMTAGFEDDDYKLVEIYCICTMARMANSERNLRNIRCRDSIGKLFYPGWSPIYGLGQIWLSALFRYLKIVNGGVKSGHAAG